MQTIEVPDFNQPPYAQSRVRHRWQPLAWLFGSVFACLAISGWLVSGENLFLVSGAVLVVAIPFVARGFLLTVERATPITVQTDGIHTYDGFGAKAFVRWQDIKRTRNMILWPGLKWLLLDDGRGYMKLAGVPVFMKDKSGFYQEVLKLVGEDHVLAVALRDNGFRK